MTMPARRLKTPSKSRQETSKTSGKKRRAAPVDVERLVEDRRAGEPERLETRPFGAGADAVHHRFAIRGGREVQQHPGGGELQVLRDQEPAVERRRQVALEALPAEQSVEAGVDPRQVVDPGNPGDLLELEPQVDEALEKSLLQRQAEGVDHQHVLLAAELRDELLVATMLGAARRQPDLEGVVDFEIGQLRDRQKRRQPDQQNTDPRSGHQDRRQRADGGTAGAHGHAAILRRQPARRPGNRREGSVGRRRAWSRPPSGVCDGGQALENDRPFAGRGDGALGDGGDLGAGRGVELGDLHQGHQSPSLVDRRR